MKPNIRTFFLKASLLALPLVVVSLLYYITDPFKIFHTYPSYLNQTTPNFNQLNRGYISIETFLNQSQERPYDSFIFGNSRSLCYEVDEWRKYIQSTGCFHLDGHSEKLFSIHGKVKWLDSIGVPIKNALIVLDNSGLGGTENPPGHIYIAHPYVSGQNRIEFQAELIQGFFDKGMLVHFYDSLKKQAHPDSISDKRFLHYDPMQDSAVLPKLTTPDPAKFMIDNNFADEPVAYEITTNEVRRTFLDALINQNPDYYYTKMRGIFNERPTTQKIAPPILTPQAKVLLTQINEIFKKHGTQVRFVISPLYDQLKTNPEDVAYLKSIFGDSAVYDYSGINNITADVHNYYEKSHYRAFIARRIIKEIYTTPAPVAELAK